MVANKEAFRANSRVLTLLQVLLACGLVQQQSLNNNSAHVQNIQATQNVCHHTHKIIVKNLSI